MYPEPRTIKVFNDHEAWDRHEKWWMIPTHLLQSLFVCVYDTDEDNFHDHLKMVEANHPECVFVY